VDALTDVRVRVVDRGRLEDGLGLQSWAGVFVRAITDRAMEMEERLNSRSRS
jgi:hypothetical protein